MERFKGFNKCSWKLWRKVHTGFREGERPITRPGCRWKDNNKIELRYKDGNSQNGLNWFSLQSYVRVFVNVLMK